MIIVLDTNVLVFGLLTPFGSSGEIVRMVSAGKLILKYDSRKLIEYQEVLNRAKLQFDKDQIDSLIDYIKKNGQAVTAGPLNKHLPDPDDAPFLEVAIEGKAEYLVKGNKVHYPKKFREGIKVLSPTEFINSIIPNKEYSARKIEKNLKTFLNQLAILIKTYFQILLKEEQIDVAIRLASIHKEKVAYKTYVRSSGLNPRREKYSEPILIDEGIASYFRNEKGCQGVLIYNDIQRAAKEGKFKITENEHRFPEDVLTMMVAPMNAWRKGVIDMIGIILLQPKNKMFLVKKTLIL